MSSSRSARPSVACRRWGRATLRAGACAPVAGKAACAALMTLALLGLGGCATKTPETVGQAARAGSTGAERAARAEAPAAAARISPPPPIDAALIGQAYAGARSYAGTLSCTGCADRNLTLTVFADGTFRLREIESAPSERTSSLAAGAAAAAARKTSFDAGRWSTAPGRADLLLLHGAATGSRLLRRAVPDGLTVLDHEGREIRGLSGTTLTRLSQVDPLPGPMRLAGLYSRAGGLGAFDDCATSRRLAVAASGRARSLAVGRGVAGFGTDRGAMVASTGRSGARCCLSGDPPNTR